jgi:hypothetical protein
MANTSRESGYIAAHWIVQYATQGVVTLCLSIDEIIHSCFAEIKLNHYE